MRQAIRSRRRPGCACRMTSLCAGVARNIFFHVLRRWLVWVCPSEAGGATETPQVPPQDPTLTEQMRNFGRNAYCCAPPAQIQTWSLNHPAPTVRQSVRRSLGGDTRSAICSGSPYLDAFGHWHRRNPVDVVLPIHNYVGYPTKLLAVRRPYNLLPSALNSQSLVVIDSERC